MRRKKSYKTRKKPVVNINKETIKKYRKANRYLRSIGLTCNNCHIEIRVNTTRPELYTDEVKKNYVCLNCRGRKEK